MGGSGAGGAVVERKRLSLLLLARLRYAVELANGKGRRSWPSWRGRPT